MKTNKLGTIFLVSILGLAGIGISYAGWIDQITVTGTVQTGYVGFDITEYSGTWVWKQISTHGKETHYGAVADTDINGDNYLNDDPAGYYGNADWILVAYSYSHNSVANEVVEFEFVNLYPCVDFKADFKFTIGTIPVILTGTGLAWSGETVDGVAQQWLEGIPGIAVTPTITEVILDNNGVQVWPSEGTVQLHPGIEYLWVLTIHIPQHNAYMNAYAAGTCTFDIIQWSDECNNQLLYKVITIPTGPFTMTVYGDYPSGWPSYFRTVITNLVGGPYSPPIAEGAQCVGWCVDNTGSGSTIQTNTPFTTYMYDSYNLPATLPGGWPAQPWMSDPDWPYVNWIINHKGSATPQQIQAAIWYFVDGGYSGTDPVVTGLINGALNNPDGSNYIPPAGQTPPSLVAAIMWVDASIHGQKQTTIIEVDP